MASIDAIEGIGPRNATKLRKAGVRTTEALLKTAASKKGRRELAAGSGIGEKSILEWVNRADLMRVKGVGEEYSDLLEAAGVDTVKELRNRNPKNLLEGNGRRQRQEATGAPPSHRVDGRAVGSRCQEARPDGDVLNHDMN